MAPTKNNHAPVIQILDLHKTYQRWFRREKVKALNGIDLEINKAEIFGFLGPNGAGKTTAVKIMLGFLRPQKGSVRIFGEPPGNVAMKKKIGYMPERASLPPYLHLKEMVRLFGRLSGLFGKTLDQKVERALELVNLADVANRTLDSFSKGMLQRASLAQALVADPELIILDEPAIGLDPIARRQLRELLLTLRNNGKTVFLNSHELEVVQLICDRFAILNKGTILAIEPIEALRDYGKYIFELGKCSFTYEQITEKLSSKAAWNAEKRHLLVDCGSVAELNRTIDELRSLEVEITSMTQHAISLEDLFLKII